MNYHNIDFKIKKYIKKNCPEWLDNVLKKYNICIAGGFIKSALLDLDFNDIDVWCKSKEQADKIIEDYKKDTFLYDISESKNAYTIRQGKCTIQLIFRWSYKNFDSLINSFDFVHCQAYYGYQDSIELYSWKKDFIRACLNKKLIYTEPDREEDCLGSYYRMIKLLQKGWSIDKENSLKILKRCFKDYKPTEKLDNTIIFKHTIDSYIEDQKDIFIRNSGGSV